MTDPFTRGPGEVFVFDPTPESVIEDGTGWRHFASVVPPATCNACGGQLEFQSGVHQFRCVNGHVVITSDARPTIR